VKVLDSSGSGYTSGILAGIDWVVKHGNIDVINMSLGGSGVDQAYDDAFVAANNAGIVVVVAAGNSSADASNYSPAYSPHAITVSALADFNGLSGGRAPSTCLSDTDDTLAYFSNFGPAVDIAAPGVCIYSTYPIEKGSYGTISGTSMAAPHVAGAAALLASTYQHPMDATDVAAIRSTLLSSGNFDWTDDSGDGIQEPLLDITRFTPSFVNGPGNVANAAPKASFTYDCPTLSCTFDGSGSSDSDGTISTYAWTFGDGGTSSGVTTGHDYAAGGARSVTLTVTDNGGATNSQTQSVTVTASSGGGGGGGGGGACDGKGTTVLLTPSSTNQGKSWTATVDVVNCVGGAETAFESTSEQWSASGSATHNCVNGVSSCTESLSGIRKNTGSVSFTLNGAQTTVLKP
jgi:subtilisin